MAAVTQRIPNYLGGLSKQSDVKKSAGQVRTCSNALPDITKGLTKRPGFSFLKTLGSTTTYDDGKWFFIKRSETETYVGVIKNGGINIWNAGTGAVCSVTIAPGTSTYINTTRDNLNVLTVQDTTIISNSNVTVTTQSAPAASTVTKATIRLLGVEYSAEYKFRIVHSGTTYTLGAEHRTDPAGAAPDDYITRNADSSLGAADPPKRILSAEELLTDFEAAINGWSISGMTVTRLNETLELSCTTAFTVPLCRGGQANDAMEVIIDSVDTIADLPVQSVHGRTVQVLNSSTAAEDNYWAEFVAEDGVSGDGYWQETRDPTVSPGLTASTMPHQLINTALNTFTFGVIPWEDRLVGDTTTNSDPSFVGSTIQQTFFYNNRLGFLTEDNVSMSQAGEYFNFYFISALTATAADPIDLSTASVRPAILHGVVPNVQGLILFSQYQQFLMYSDEGNITPSNVQIRGISNYEVDTLIDPVEMKDAIMFLNKSASYSNVYAMKTMGDREQPQVVDIGRIISETIPDGVTDMIASSTNSMLGIYGKDLEDVYWFRTYDTGEETLYQAWYTWKLPGDVQFCYLEGDEVYAVVRAANKYSLLVASLNQTDAQTTLVTADGTTVNPNIDYYSVATSVVYDATNRWSKCYIPFDHISTATPVVLIAGTGGSDPNAGLYYRPTVATDGGGTYFRVDNEDLSGSPSDVIVGYLYEFEVELPKTYFRLDENSADFTASLIIKRYRFSIGLSGAVEFRTRPTGEAEWSELIPVIEADFYGANDVPLAEDSVMTVPIHQRNTNFDFSVFSDSPFPVTINGMMWEGQYSPKYYRRT